MSVVLVCGSRDWSDFNLIDHLLASQLKPGDTVRHGDCPRGADEMASAWCSQNGYKQDPMPADWDTHGKAAGPIRNAAMLAKEPTPTVVLAFMANPKWSPGSGNMVQQAEKAGVPVILVQQR